GLPFRRRQPRCPKGLRLWPGNPIAAIALEFEALAGIDEGIIVPSVSLEHDWRDFGDRAWAAGDGNIAMGRQSFGSRCAWGGIAERIPPPSATSNASLMATQAGIVSARGRNTKSLPRPTRFACTCGAPFGCATCRKTKNRRRAAPSNPYQTT